MITTPALPRLRVDPATGLLDAAAQRPSPNHDPRPPNEVIDLIIIHGISLPPGRYGGPWIDALFRNRLQPNEHPYFAAIYQLKVSAHLLIRRGGGVVQYVSFKDRAWHAGASCFQGRERCNDYSIGIELEGSDEDPYSDAQYLTAANVIGALQAAYPAISDDRIAGHSDVAPGRKTDPGPAFCWPRLRRLLAADSGAATHKHKL